MWVNIFIVTLLIFCRFTGTQSKQDNDNYNGLSKRLRSYTCKLMTSDLDFLTSKGLSWSYGCWIYIYLCNQCLSSLKLWVWIPLMAMCIRTTLCDKVCQWLAAGPWFSQGSPVSSTNKTDHHNMTEILLKVALNCITLSLTNLLTSIY